jgi:hypothetical protein
MPAKTPQPLLENQAELSPVAYGSEFELFHTRLLRISLAVEDSRAYWEHLNMAVPPEKRAIAAFEERWFGSKSLDRVQGLVAEFNHRYDQYSAALEVLRRWKPSDSVTRETLCHWHLQLADPLYREFTGSFLVQRRLSGSPTISRDIAARWVEEQIPKAWSVATLQRMATSLIAGSSAAGLCTTKPGTRALTFPKVTDEALSYWLYFLRNLSFKGSLLENPYFGSVGLTDGFLENRLRQLPALTFSRMGDLVDFHWQFESLSAWVTHILQSEGEKQL